MNNKTREEIAKPLMYNMLNEFGLQITLKVLIDSLDELIEKRGKTSYSLLMLEALKGLHAGYIRRNEVDE